MLSKLKIVVSTFCLIIFFSINTSAQPDSTIVLLGTGDTMLGSWASGVIADSGMAYPFERIKPIFNETDVVFTNLEAPFGTSGTAYDKKFTFRVPPKYIDVLKDGNVNLVSLANNHTMDFGVESLRETIDLLQLNNINFAGAGENLKEARKASIMNVKGKRIGFLSLSLTFPEEFWASDTSAGTYFPYEEIVFDDVRALENNCDFVIISCHWGQELRDTPKPYQTKLARRLIDNGADLILGHHPHIVQGIEQYKDRWIVYSLGNFIFGSYSESARDSFIFRLEITNENQTVAQVIPINVYNKQVNFRPELLEGDQKEAFIQKLKSLSLELNNGNLGITTNGIINVSKI